MDPKTSERSDVKEETAPAPDDPRKPDELSDLHKRSWGYIVKKTFREFGEDEATDLAAALTYYAVLAVFPALLAVVSIVGLFGDPQQTTDMLLGILSGLLSDQTIDVIREPLTGLAQSPSAGLTFAVGVIGAVWSASGYVVAFSRAMNRIYETDEGRPFWKLRPVMLGITVVGLIAAVIAAVLVTASGPVAREIAQAMGLPEEAVVVWDIAKWLLIAVLAVVIVAVLYYATPNVKQPKFRWISVGALVALATWALASLAFGFYVVNFASYNRTYGAIGSVIVFLLWLWISNLALLFGAELDAELERGRQLQAGIKAEETIQLPPRDSRQSDKKQRKREEDVEEGRALRESSGKDAESPRDLDAKERETSSRDG
ncbi:YihY/virulence factor BrkB family protein [Microbacterium sp. SS28]|uniref:YihY/virulence factor BrkB family protein n=1 Tax=Microbacterium sp. SS28 TaxID=2919948 RepID=UPI001FA995EF|nr:YihY/virulence factor BrkB family protein [Microbacterium sp. SS28]